MIWFSLRFKKIFTETFLRRTSRKISLHDKKARNFIWREINFPTFLVLTRRIFFRVWSEPARYLNAVPRGWFLCNYCGEKLKIAGSFEKGKLFTGRRRCLNVTFSTGFISSAIIFKASKSTKNLLRPSIAHKIFFVCYSHWNSAPQFANLSFNAT